MRYGDEVSTLKESEGVTSLPLAGGPEVDQPVKFAGSAVHSLLPSYPQSRFPSGKPATTETELHFNFQKVCRTSALMPTNFAPL